MPRFCVFAFTLALLASTVPARGQLVVHQGTFSTAGGTATGAGFELFSSLGTTEATSEMNGAGFTLTGGLVAIASTGAVPQVQHAVPGVVSQNEQVAISVQVDGSVRSAMLNYRAGGESTYRLVAMARDGGSFLATVPDSTVDSRGLTYFITIEDDLGRTFRSPALGTYSVSVQIPGEGVTRTVAQPAGSEQSAYRLVSVPIQPEDARPEAVLVDDLGPYDPQRWRFFGLDFNQAYQELPEIDSLQRGSGYWLITSEADRVIDTGPGVSTPTDEPFMVLLHPRWNLVGTPFDFAVPSGQVSMSSGQGFALRALDGSWNDPVRNPVRFMRPFEGYAVFNNLQRVDTLLVYPHPRSSAKTGPNADDAPYVLASASKTSAEEWALHLSARSESSLDADNYAGVSTRAQDGFDAYDLPEPPRFGNFLSLSFPRAAWSAASNAFCTDIRSVNDEGHVWEFAVESGKAEIVGLRFAGVDELPPDREAWLVDERLAVAVDLREDPRYQVATDGETPLMLKLVVGSAEFAAGLRPAAAELPSRLTVTDVFPNPFSTVASIRYVLPEDDEVSIIVYNAVGAEVARLSERTSRSAGAHLAVWDGRTSAGYAAPSGVYFIRLNARSAAHTAKVVFVR